MSPDNGNYLEAGIRLVPGEPLKPRPGDMYLGEALVVHHFNPESLIVDQVQICVRAILPEGRVAVDIVAIPDGKEYHNEADVSELTAGRFGVYQLTRRLGVSPEVPVHPGSYWRAFAGNKRRR